VCLIVVVVDGLLGRQANEVTPTLQDAIATARWPRVALVVIATSVEPLDGVLILSLLATRMPAGPGGLVEQR
jgi:hypothetical protein